jgi:hypothetical protein
MKDRLIEERLHTHVCVRARALSRACVLVCMCLSAITGACFFVLCYAINNIEHSISHTVLVLLASPLSILLSILLVTPESLEAEDRPGRKSRRTLRNTPGGGQPCQGAG